MLLRALIAAATAWLLGLLFFTSGLDLSTFDNPPPLTDSKNGELTAAPPKDPQIHPLCDPGKTNLLPAGLALACGIGHSYVPPFLYARVIRLPWEKISGDGMPTRNSDQVRTLHLLIFFLTWVVTGQLFLRIWPYSRHLRQLDLMIRGLSSKTRQEWLAAESPWNRLLGVIFGRDHETYQETDPLDPRTIESATLNLLEEIQEGTIVFSASGWHFSIPAPEIIFKFDELDKLGVSVLPAGAEVVDEQAPRQGLEVERRRNQAVQGLFADIKNLIGSGAARFIFIGGRNLHDEWHADLGDRRPLLTNIFTREIFLPSLLADHPPLYRGNADRPTRRQLIDLSRIEDYFSHLRGLCVQAKAMSSQGRRQGLPIETYRYSQAEQMPSPNPAQQLVFPPILGKSESADGQLTPGHMHDFFRQFLCFLSYRSRGNPRRLRMILESFLHNKKRNLESDHYPQGADFDANDDFLVFTEPDRVRIQVIAEIYHRFNLAIGQRYSLRDDRLIGGALHLSDFLLKFHRRAFAWRNLQRVDELAHTYRSPELPQVLELLVRAWTGRYLHRIRNGMYDYRFNAEFSQELRYVSRSNEDEMAALNFTRDEAQELKGIYLARFRQQKDEHSWEFVSALGELHEFDEEYELSRFYYFKAMALLDAGLEKEVKLNGRNSAFYEVVTQSGTGLEIQRRWIAWSISRLRLSLQIGMTYERSGDLEQAQARYRLARTFAAGMIRALLNSTKNDKDPNAFLKILDIPDYGHQDLVSTLKNLSLLFQPAFAEAWVAQKQVSGVDTGIRLLERSLWELRWLLPTVKDEFGPLTKRKLDLDGPPSASNTNRRSRELHVNLYLTMAELHSKLGDLLFYRADPIVDRKSNEDGAITRRGGYLGRAHYHYALAVHEMRSFICVRSDRSRHLQFIEEKFLKQDDRPVPWPQIGYEALADFLTNIGDTLIARSSSKSIVQQDDYSDGDPLALLEPGKLKCAIDSTIVALKGSLENSGAQYSDPVDREDLLRYFTCFPKSTGTLELNQILGKRRNVNIKASWLDDPNFKRGFSELHRKSDAGATNSLRKDIYGKISNEDVRLLIDFSANEPLTDRQAIAFHFILLLTASSLLEEAGLLEDSARISSRISETALAYIEISRCFATHRFQAERSDPRFAGTCYEGRFLFSLAALAACGESLTRVAARR